MLQLNSAPSRTYLNATSANDPTVYAEDAWKSFPSPKHSYRINSLHLGWWPLEIVTERHRSISRVTPVVHQVRSRGRKAPAKRQVESPRKTHARLPAWH